MIIDNVTGRELRLRLVSLAMSIGLHVGLGLLAWQGLHALSGDDAPIVVALVERPVGKPGESAPTALPRTKALPPSPSRPRPVPARAAPDPPRPVQPAAAESVSVVPAVPATATVEEIVSLAAAVDVDLPAGDGAAGRVLPVPGTGGSGSGTGHAVQGAGRAADGDGQGGSAGLIRATPRYESNPLPPYPRLARQNRWEGTVRLRARVTERGTIERVDLERSSGHAVLDRSALDGVRYWRFIPATRNGVPVACEVSIPVAFRLTE